MTDAVSCIDLLITFYCTVVTRRNWVVVEYRWVVTDRLSNLRVQRCGLILIWFCVRTSTILFSNNKCSGRRPPSDSSIKPFKMVLSRRWTKYKRILNDIELQFYLQLIAILWFPFTSIYIVCSDHSSLQLLSVSVVTIPFIFQISMQSATVPWSSTKFHLDYAFYSRGCKSTV